MTSLLSKRDNASLFRPWWNRGPLATLREEVEELFENAFGSSELMPQGGRILPSIDVSETNDYVEVRTDLPGFKADEIDIQVGEGGLTISGEHTEEKTSEKDGERKYHRVERRTGSFSRFVHLPCPVKEDGIQAELKDGILTIQLPKSEEAKTRKIPVKG
ncbi:MAG: Hsp20/alpha crystallin family protein [Planctomycetaceae bacterium]